MILDPGTFRVSDYRKSIPDAVKVECVQRKIRAHFEATGELHAIAYAPAKRIRYDHRPRLEERPYDAEAGDFVPKQHDPEHIDAILDVEHDFRTFGRKPDAEKVVTTRGSDLGEAARIRKIRQTQAIHAARMVLKGGELRVESENVGMVANAIAPYSEGRAQPKPKKKYQWAQGRKLQSRPFNSKGKK